MKIDKNTLFYGDNLEILREYIDDESIDLVYLDPPFSSNKTYNVLFKERTEEEAAAQIVAFEDTWHWGETAEQTYQEIVDTAPDNIVRLIEGFLEFVGRNNDVMAYLVMMTIRLLELHRVLKETGSLYLHCDPTASHYLKLILDTIFDKRNFRNEIIWQYRGAGVSRRCYGRRHDTIFFYTKSDRWTFNVDEIREPYAEPTIERFKHYIGNVRGNRDYGIQKLHPKGKHPDDVWAIQPIAPSAKERLGYPTQKPLILLEKIIKASSNEGDWVLDPFCGCGTTIVAAHRLKRRWIGIDITPLAIGVMENRLADTFGSVEYKVRGLPVDMSGARTLAAKDPYAFQLWAVGKIRARPAREKRGADEGIDGVFYRIVDDTNKPIKGVVQVKSGRVHVRDIREFIHVVETQRAQIGVFVTLEKPTGPMRKEALAQGLYEREGFEGKYPRIQILTIEEILAGKGIQLPSLASSVDISLTRAKRDKAKPEDLTEKLL